MQTKLLVLFLSLISSIFTVQAQSINGDMNGDGVLTVDDITLLVDAVLRASSEAGSNDYVDLGLTSGTLWATCNLGATNPTDYGNYYAWGEIKTKKTFTIANYVAPSLEAADELPVSADAAYLASAGNWRIPSSKQMDELIRECSWTWTKEGPTKGYKVEGPNKKSIFLPAAGQHEYSAMDQGITGYYWTRTISPNDEDSAPSLSIHSNGHKLSQKYNHIGLSIRPVMLK